MFRKLSVLATLGLMLVLGVACDTMPASAQSGACANEALRAQQGYALALPDCRAYEQVSPTQKNGGDAAGLPGAAGDQSSADGNVFTFFSQLPFPIATGASAAPTYQGTRRGEGWTAESILPALVPQSGAEELGSPEDLADTVLRVSSLRTGGDKLLLRDNATGAERLLVALPQGANVHLAGFTADDERFLFEASGPLLADAAPGVINLYEWNGSQLQLAGLLPDGHAPSGGAVAGAGGSAVSQPPGGASNAFYTQGAISADGSRVFFTDVGTGQVYMREPGVGVTIPVSNGTAHWVGATPDGSRVYYTEGEQLYRFAAANDTREALTPPSSGVLGTLGTMGPDSAYLYFVATAVLSANENAGGEAAELGAANLYEWHEGATAPIFITRLLARDEADWRDSISGGEPAGPALGGKASQVNTAGTVLLFASYATPTPAYDNAGYGEIYRFDATQALSVSNPACLSCGASPASSSGFLDLQSLNPIASAPVRALHLTRNLSSDGGRVFFQTAEALVPQDTNEMMDVYEWELEGEGRCTASSVTFSTHSGGCLYLISSGRSTSPSYLGDADSEGQNVFFFTRQPLLRGDVDQNVDVYDARVEGGIATQNAVATPPSCMGDECRGGPLAPSAPLALATTSTTSSGNVVPQSRGPSSVSKRRSKPLTRAQRRSDALHACARQRNKARRSHCQAMARRRYGTPKATKDKGGTR